MPSNLSFPNSTMDKLLDQLYAGPGMQGRYEEEKGKFSNALAKYRAHTLLYTGLVALGLRVRFQMDWRLAPLTALTAVLMLRPRMKDPGTVVPVLQTRLFAYSMKTYDEWAADMKLANYQVLKNIEGQRKYMLDWYNGSEFHMGCTGGDQDEYGAVCYETNAREKGTMRFKEEVVRHEYPEVAAIYKEAVKRIPGTYWEALQMTKGE
jgi:hypothetical protein